MRSRDILLLLTVALGAGPLAALELEQVRLEMRRASPAWKSAAAEGRVALDASLAAFAWPDPELSFEWMYLRWPYPDLTQAPATRWTLGQTLPFPGKTLLKGLEERHNARRAQARAQALQADLLRMAEEAWWDWQGSRLDLEALERAQAAWGSLQRTSGRRARFGRLDRGGQLMDLLLRREAVGLQARALDLRQEARAAQERLAALLGRTPSQPLPEPAPLDLGRLQARRAEPGLILAQARRHNPELAEARHHVEHARSARRSALAGWLPDLRLEGGVEDDALHRHASLRLGLSLPMVWAWGQAGRTAAAGAELEHARQALAQAGLDLEQEAGRLARAFNAAAEALALQRSQGLALAEQALELAASAYASGDIGAADAMAAVMAYRDSAQAVSALVRQVGYLQAAITRLSGASPEGSHHE